MYESFLFKDIDMKGTYTPHQERRSSPETDRASTSCRVKNTFARCFWIMALIAKGFSLPPLVTC
ncbi:hypothetical protein BDR03DRAFT_967463 [Suillus americanus]|nr:hypothetical protein BDR03DRAFT_967463 [Suillus americanus]